MNVEQENSMLCETDNNHIPEFSIIVPVYNGERTISRCIEALLNQDCTNDRFEIVVVDNNSCDETPNIVRQYPVKLLFETRRQSSYAARNTGALHAKGEILLMTDADCIADAKWLSELTQPFMDPSVAIVTGDTADATPTTEVEEFLAGLALFSKDTIDQSFPAVHTGNVAIRRDVFHEVGMFNDQLYTGGDVDLGWRVKLHMRRKIVHVAQAIVYHKHRQTISGLYRQFKRHGFGEIMLDSMYKNYPGYFRTPWVQYRRIFLQLWAIVNYLRALLFRTVGRLWGRYSRDDQAFIFYRLIAESASVIGKLEGLRKIRFFRISAMDISVEDPTGK